MGGILKFADEVEVNDKIFRENEIFDKAGYGRLVLDYNEMIFIKD